MGSSHWRGVVLLFLVLTASAGLFAQAPGNSAAFVRTDSSTQGNWPSTYGADGYFLPTISASQPSYVSAFSAQNANIWTWASSTTDPRALRIPGGNSETATTWYNSASFYFDITLAAGQTHQIALYAMDWDSQSRSESISVLDGDTGSVLDSRTISNFVNGEYLIWNISGHVKINIATLAGPNAVVSGVFFGGTNLTIHVPADEPTIQAAINAAQNGYTVLVAPGTYNENINFNGKAITVTSSAGPSTTIIDGSSSGTVVTFDTGETASSILNGFTIQHGLSGDYAGGIQITSASPTITGNVITQNRAPVGLGISVNGGSPLIQNNVITANSSQYGDGGEGGGGILITGGEQSLGSPQIIGNTITNNGVAAGGSGGGIAAWYFSNPTIRGNLISGNTAYNDGGGIAIHDYDGAIIVENLIVDNTSIDGNGGGLYVATTQGSVVTAIANTLATNTPGNLYTSGFPQGDVFTNNIFESATGQQGITCDGSYSNVSPLFSYNDVYSGGQLAWGGVCDYTTNPGNISVDPMFVNPAVSNYHLQPASPAINVGNNSAPDLPATDFDGNSRIYNGIVDLGAYEYQGLTTISFSQPSLSFPSQSVGGSSQPMSVTLTNTGNTALQISSIAASTGFSETDTCQTASGLAAGSTCQINVQFAPLQPNFQSGAISVSANITSSPAGFSVSGTGAANSGGSSANFLGTDSTTRGNWSATYGADGYSIANGPQTLPAYDPSFSVLGQSNWTWVGSTTDPRALQLPGGAGGTAATWYGATNFSFDVNLTDGNTHQVALYALDWDQQNRSETVQVVDAASGTLLSSTSVSNFANGEYLIWTVSGHVRINVAMTAGPNCVVSGVFFGGAIAAPPASPSLSITKTHTGHVLQGQQGLVYTVTVTNAVNAGPTSGAVTVTELIPSGLTLVSMAGNNWTCPANTTYCTRSDSLGAGANYDPITVTVNVASNASSPQVNQVSVSGGGSATANTSDSTIIESTGGGGAATATFFGNDRATQGAWQGSYGIDGYSLAGAGQSLPDYDPSFALQNQYNWTWATNPADPRALQVPQSGTIAAAWYNQTTFSLDVNLTDGQQHYVALYALDWDNQGRSETIQILDANSNAQLDQESVSNFASGVYLLWNLSGHVKIVVTATAGPNCVVSGLFFGVGSSIVPQNEWTWMSGSMSANQWGIYGTVDQASASNVPGARQSPVTWTDTSGNLWLFGGYGYDSVGTSFPMNDLWKYTAGQWTWVSGPKFGGQIGVYGVRGQPSATNIPGARYEAMSWTDSSGAFWLFGGEGYDAYGTENTLSDLWRYSNGEWTWIAGPNVGGQAGSYGTEGQASSGNNPGARISGLTWVDSSGNLWLFGGLGFDSVGNTNELNDLWEYSNGQWTWVAGSNLGGESGNYGSLGVPANTNFPGARAGATGWKDLSGNFWLFGGVGYNAGNYSGVLNDLWRYSNGVWTWMGGSTAFGQASNYGTQGVAGPANAPGARQFSSGWVDAAGNFWLFGGNGVDSTGASGYLNDLWKYSSGQWTWMAGAKVINQLGSSVTQGTPAAGNTPSGRFRSGAWTDVHGNFWLFGGFSGFGALDDLWRYVP